VDVTMLALAPFQGGVVPITLAVVVLSRNHRLMAGKPLACWPVLRMDQPSIE
jgi:hypothetical protein